MPVKAVPKHKDTPPSGIQSVTQLPDHVNERVGHTPLLFQNCLSKLLREATQKVT